VTHSTASTDSVAPSPVLSRVQRQRAQLLVALAGLVLFAIVLVRTAWVGDDAYISFRTVDNFLHGYGLRWNVAERVQSYTHPLWLFVVSACAFVTREIYYTVMALSIGLSLATLSLVLRRVALTPFAAAFAAVGLVSSKAFVDYSTSGLENPLTHVLLVLLFLAWRDSRAVGPAAAGPAAADAAAAGAATAGTAERTFLLCVLAALIVVNRMDVGVLIAPLMATVLWRVRSRAAIVAVLLGALPFVAWEIFSVIYYGVPFPNTAYAKLNTGVPRWWLWQQGYYYWVATWRWDRATLLLLGGASAALVLARSWRVWPFLLGAGLYCVYVTRIGGDFMSGRFFAAPMLWVLLALVGLARERWQPRVVDVDGPAASSFLASWRTGIHGEARNAAWLAGAAAILLVVLTQRGGPPWLSGTDFGSQSRWDHPLAIAAHTIADERKVYYPTTGLLRQTTSPPLMRHDWARDGLRFGQDPRSPAAFERSSPGFFGYYAGPRGHLIDNHALTDPLLARLPTLTWHIGHFLRVTPAGYVESCAQDRNLIVDPDLRVFYDKIRLITRGPIWSWDRFTAIWALNRGHYDGLIDRFLARVPQKLEGWPPKFPTRS